MNAHVVSRFYLDAFSSTPGEKRRKMRRIWARPRSRTGTWTDESLDGVAALPDYYSTDGGPSVPGEGIEGILGNIENLAAPVLRRLLNSAPSDLAHTDDVSLSSQDRPIFATFVVSLALRVPVFHRLLQPQIDTELSNWFRKRHDTYVSDPAEFQREIAEIRASTGSNEFDTLTADDFRPDGLTITATKLAVLASSFQILMPLTLALLNDTEWIFLVAEPPTFFVTSDHPVFGFTELHRPDAQISVPLSPRVALWADLRSIGAFQPRTSRWRPANARTVARVNLRTLAAADNWFAAEQFTLKDLLSQAQVSNDREISLP